jgi:predicted small lipoprotein YifL
MKNRFTWLLAGAMMLGISACGSNGDGDVSYDEAADTAAEVAVDAGEAAEEAADAAAEAVDEAAADVADTMEEIADDVAETVAIKDDFVATDPATVALGNGTPHMVEFYAEW